MLEAVRQKGRALEGAAKSRRRTGRSSRRPPLWTPKHWAMLRRSCTQTGSSCFTWSKRLGAGRFHTLLKKATCATTRSSSSGAGLRRAKAWSSRTTRATVALRKPFSAAGASVPGGARGSQKGSCCASLFMLSSFSFGRACVGWLSA